MRKIIVGAQVSMDGVMQAPGGPTEDPTRGFKFGGWAMPYFDQAFGEEIDHVFKKFDLLLGRKTYEIFAAYWPYYEEEAALGDALLANDLVDALSIFTLPVVLGGGKKLFADGSAPHSFKLTRSRVSPNGLIVGHYEREGEIKIGAAPLDSPNEREIARQERMKREG
jgi:dihydrofolate reductase